MGARGVASITDQGATAAASFLASVFIGRHLGAGALGIYAITAVFVVLIRSFQNSLILEPMSVYGVRRKSEDRASYFWFLIGFDTLWVGGLAALLAIGSVFAWALGRIDASTLYALLASSVFSVLICFQFLLRRQFYIDFRQYLAMIQSLSYLLLNAAGFALMWWFDGWSVSDVYILLCVCSVLVCVFLGGRFWTSFTRPTTAEIRRYWKEHWGFGKWIMLTVPLGIATYQGYFFIVGALVSTEAAGLLKAADTLVAPFFQVAIGMSLMLTPMASRNIDQMSLSAQRSYSLRLSLPLVALAAAYGIAIYFGGEYALRALFGAKIAPAFPVVKIMAFLPLFMASPLPATVILSAMRRSNLRFLSQSIALLGTMGIGVPLVLIYGLEGAAAGLVLTEILFGFSQWGCLFWLWRRASQRKAP
jgi:O-antigen/teichoic acid export membrane protein